MAHVPFMLVTHVTMSTKLHDLALEMTKTIITKYITS